MIGISQRESCRPHFKAQKILHLPCLFIYTMCEYVFKNKTSFQRNEQLRSANTRRNDDLHVPYAKYDHAFYAPSRLGPRFFNNLPEDIKSCDSLRGFQRKLKGYLVDNNFYSVSKFIDL